MEKSEILLCAFFVKKSLKAVMDTILLLIQKMALGPLII